VGLRCGWGSPRAAGSGVGQIRVCGLVVRPERVDHVQDSWLPGSSCLRGWSQGRRLIPFKVWGDDNGCSHPGVYRSRDGTDLPFFRPSQPLVGFGRFPLEDEVPCLYKYSGTPLGAQCASAGKTRCHLVYASTKTGCKTNRNFSLNNDSRRPKLARMICQSE